jgi:hypothetical protein
MKNLKQDGIMENGLGRSNIYKVHIDIDPKIDILTNAIKKISDTDKIALYASTHMAWAQLQKDLSRFNMTIKDIEIEKV